MLYEDEIKKAQKGVVVRSKRLDKILEVNKQFGK